MPLDVTRVGCTVGAAALGHERSSRWRPGLTAQGSAAPCHSEIFAPSGDGSGAAAALALALDDWRNTPRPEGCEAEDRRAVLWVQMREAARLVGRPYRPGLPEDVRSSARMRWNVASAPSPEPRWNPQAPGTPAWHAELFRARGHRPGEWVLGDGGRRLAARSFEAPSKEHAPFEQASCKAPAFPA